MSCNLTERSVRGAALVTGAGKRIGKVLAVRLAEAGYDIAVHYHTSPEEARDTLSLVRERGRKGCTVEADLSCEMSASALVRTCTGRLGPLTLLVNCASVFEHDDIDTMTRESWDLHMETNLRAPLLLSQEFIRQAPEDSNNLVVNIVDQRVLKQTPQFLSYTLSKVALFALTKPLAQAVGNRGIRVNAIGPGPVLRNHRQSEDDWKRQNAATVLGHGATPEDIADALVYLVDARAVTGQMIAVDGGQHITWRTPDVSVGE